ncbi:(deoxy)nucleoside triphosphate pyrophosphohydrolase [Belliella kenyensis]|uniref:8-oxo-dGTP diphosphatase n=1 Tax=Belliella kenyensis TaxID=1472724 RepID=A0ABV8EMD7_9BACT|nr:(deoxy)nucleoside triphosphate pyrophosphohydrolase [Belliella kenyensis]MCH7400557.1 (deoxy)nucleoside triphosphate pyrophosphohydrolase [Belliella kenyensis]MDN3602156.1 (deoxy)nucleoside triphosphate pyrophosphohydrolase [Belliella kenyensis]
MFRTIKVTCAIIIHQEKILVAQRSEYMSNPLKWEFPGGKLENHESLEECIKREILEELNLKIETLTILNKNTHQIGENLKIELIPFICRYIEGELSLKEHRSAQWLRPAELDTLDWSEADIPILNQLMNHKSIQEIS